MDGGVSLEFFFFFFLALTQVASGCNVPIGNPAVDGFNPAPPRAVGALREGLCVLISVSAHETSVVHQ